MDRPVAYVEGLTDSRRWQDFEFRSGDIVISAPSKCGTTWLQMICALLIFGPQLPEPLTRLSPWLDMRLQPLDDLRSRLAAQRHRRLIKTHTPLDGLPQRPEVSYLVIGRDPRDVGISMAHHRANLDDQLIRRRLSATGGARPRTQRAAPIGLHDQVMAWFEDDRPVAVALSTLKGMTWHLGQAFRRRDQDNIVLLHYADLVADLDRQLRLLATRLEIDTPPAPWPELVRKAQLDSMRAEAVALVPDEGIGLVKDAGRFFHAGRMGQWADLLDADDLRRYDQRLATVAEPEVISWLHQG